MTAVNINANGELRRRLVSDCFVTACYKGTEAELVAADVARPEWLPGKPGNNRVQQRVVISGDGAATILRSKGGSEYRRAPDETLLKVVRVSGRTFRVFQEPEPPEIAERSAELEKQWEVDMTRRSLEWDEKKRREREAEEEAQRKPEEWDPRGFRDWLVVMARASTALFLGAAENGTTSRRVIPAHRLSASDRERIKQKVGEIVMLIDSATVEPINHAARPRPALSLVKG